jgi:hypothetical protein
MGCCTHGLQSLKGLNIIGARVDRSTKIHSNLFFGDL